MVDSTAEIPAEGLLHTIITEIEGMQSQPFDNTTGMFDSFLLNHSRCDSVHLNEMLAKFGPEFPTLELGSGLGDEAPRGSYNRSSTSNLNRVASNEAFIEENSERISPSRNDLRVKENPMVTSRELAVIKSQLQLQQDMIFELQKNNLVLKNPLQPQQDMIFELLKNNFVLKSQLQPQQHMILELQKNNLVLKSQLQPQHEMISELQKNNSELESQVKQQREMISELRNQLNTLTEIYRLNLQPLLDERVNLQTQVDQGPTTDRTQVEIVDIDNVTTIERSQLRHSDQLKQFQEIKSVESPDAECNERRVIITGSKNDGSLDVEHEHNGSDEVEHATHPTQLYQDPEEDNFDQSDSFSMQVRSFQNRKGDGQRITYNMESSEASHENPRNSRKKKSKTISCGECNKRFHYNSELTIHLRMHSGEKPHKCKECNSAFSQSCNLRRHQRIHSGEKPYKCKECNSSFNQSGSLKAHQRVHSGNKPHKCKECNSAFHQSGSLKAHQRIHSGERPYKCKDCNSAFRQLGDLRTHQRTHSGEKPYQCKECKSAFSQSCNLRRHQRNHFGKKSHKCNVCEQEFRFQSNLKNHLKIHSNEKST